MLSYMRVYCFFFFMNAPRFNFKHIRNIPYKAIDWIGSSSSLVVHTILFAVSFALGLFGVSWDRILLVVTTIVSLEAIYLAIFIQMSVNRTTQSLQEVEENIDEIQEDVKDLGEDVDEIQEDVIEIAEDVQEMQEDVQEIQADEAGEETEEAKTQAALEKIESQLQNLIKEIEQLKKH